MAGGVWRITRPPGTPKSRGASFCLELCGGVAGTFFLAQVLGFQGYEDEAEVRRAAAGEAESHDGEGAEDVRILANDIGCALGDVGGIAERSALRRLHDAQQVVLVFVGQECRGHALVEPDSDCQAGKKDDQHEPADTQDAVGDAAVDEGGLVNGAVDRGRRARAFPAPDAGSTLPARVTA